MLVGESPSAKDQGGGTRTAALSRDTPPAQSALTGEGPANPVSPQVALADTAEDELVFAPGGSLVATYGDGPGGSGKRIRIWSADGTLLQTLTPELGVIDDARFSADGSRLAIADHDTVLVWDTGSGEQVIALQRTERIRARVFLGCVLD